MEPTTGQRLQERQLPFEELDVGADFTEGQDDLRELGVGGTPLCEEHPCQLRPVLHPLGTIEGEEEREVITAFGECSLQLTQPLSDRRRARFWHRR